MAALFGRFSRNSESLLVEAQNIAQRLGRPVRSDVVVLAILTQQSTMAQSLLTANGANYTKLVEKLNPDHGNHPRPVTTHTQEMQILLEEAIKLASHFNSAYVEIEHLLYVIAKVEKLSGYRLS